MKRSLKTLLTSIVGTLPVALCALVLSSAATASPVSYTIDFTGTGILPTGTFTYDAALPLGSRFTAFTVIWDGVTFDLTAGSFSANNPDFSNAGGQCTDDAFLLLSTGSACADHASGFPQWGGSLIPTLTYLTFFDRANNATDQIDFGENIAGVNLEQFGTGGWQITALPEPVPEPAFPVLVIAGGTLMLLFRKKWPAKRSAQSDQVRRALP